MKNWQEDLLDIFSDAQASTSDVFEHIEAAALALGFEHVAYGFKAPLPLSEPKVVLLNNYPQAWRALSGGRLPPRRPERCAGVPVAGADRLVRPVVSGRARAMG